MYSGYSPEYNENVAILNDNTVFVDAINHALSEEMGKNKKMLIYGQDIADPKGGVFTATKGLTDKYGKDRVIDVMDEDIGYLIQKEYLLLNGIEITKLGGRSYGESIRKDTSGIHDKYWISRNKPIHQDNGPGTDMFAVKNSTISITPLHLGLTDNDNISSLQVLLSGISDELNQAT